MMRTGLCTLMTTVLLSLSPAQAGAADDLPPFEMSPRPDVVQQGETGTVLMVFEADVDVADLTGLLRAERVGGGADPVAPTSLSGTGEGRVIAAFDFPTWGTWEIVVFPGVVDRSSLVDAGYPDRVAVEVRRATPGWVLLLVLGGLALTLATLVAAAGGRHRTAPWDRKRKPGNPLSREPI